MSIHYDFDHKYRKTSSFYAAAFLFAKGLTLVNIDKVTDPKRAQFVFLESPELESLLHGFNFASDGSTEVLVDARRFVVAIKQLKDKLYQDNP